jgi:hypothetical protein
MKILKQATGVLCALGFLAAGASFVSAKEPKTGADDKQSISDKASAGNKISDPAKMEKTEKKADDKGKLPIAGAVSSTSTSKE